MRAKKPLLEPICKLNAEDKETTAISKLEDFVLTSAF